MNYIKKRSKIKAVRQTTTAAVNFTGHHPSTALPAQKRKDDYTTANARAYEIARPEKASSR